MQKVVECTKMTNWCHTDDLGVAHPKMTMEWMGAVRMRAQTADKNITPLHSSPSANSLWREKLCVRNKSIIKKKSDFNFKMLLSAKMNPPQWCFLQWKVIWSESGEKSAQIKHWLKAKTVQKRQNHKCWGILMRENYRRWTCLTGGSIDSNNPFKLLLLAPLEILSWLYGSWVPQISIHMSGEATIHKRFSLEIR